MLLLLLRPAAEEPPDGDCYFTDYFGSYFDVCGEEPPQPDTSVDQAFPPYAFFQDRTPVSFTFDIPKDDEEVLLMFAQFVTADQVH